MSVETPFYSSNRITELKYAILTSIVLSPVGFILGIVYSLLFGF